MLSMLVGMKDSTVKFLINGLAACQDKKNLLYAFVSNLKIVAIYALYPESFCDKNLAVRKVFAFSDSAEHMCLPKTICYLFRCCEETSVIQSQVLWGFTLQSPSKLAPITFSQTQVLTSAA